MIKKYIKGFTLVELMVVIGVIGLMVAITIPTLSKFKEQQSLRNTVDDVVSLLNQARSDTLSSLSSTNYSVYFQSDRATYFVGSSYTAGLSTNKVALFSDVADVPVVDGLTLAGGGSIVTFNRLTGDTSQYGTIKIQLVSDSNVFKVINVGKTGFIGYQ
jgi:prepilin-type N-terminal cleavage/methylation domain-containing protein